jgi:predicted negative regulator of RcsB-dependent stress response
MLQARGNLDAALTQSIEAMRLEPASCLAHQLHAQVLLARKQPGEALTAIDTALATAARDPEVIASRVEGDLRQTRADVLAELGRVTEAREEYETVLRLLSADDDDVPEVRSKLHRLPRP